MIPSNSTTTPSKIFISYRRAESTVHAGRLYDQLAARFGSQFVDIDIESIEPGRDFDKAIEAMLASCKIMLVIIGQQWLTCTDEYSRRLDNPNDFVRREIAAALNRGVRIIPVLVQGAIMPRAQDLPDELAPLVLRQNWEVRDRGWKDDVRKLINWIEGDITSTQAYKDLREGAERAAPEKARRGKKGLRYALIAVISLVIIAVVSVFALRPILSKLKVEPTPTPIATAQPTGTLTPTPTPSPSPARSHVNPMTRDDLISSIKLGRSTKATAERYIALINSHGVDFALTPEDEEEIRRSGDYLGVTGLDNLVAAIRNNYRPSASPSPTATAPGDVPRASSAPESGEPTEEEMKEALLRTMEKRGGQRKGGDSVVIGNPIAGMTIKIEKFEKLGCKPANYGAGYECTYNSTISQSFHSNDGTARGDQQADAWNKFLKGLGGGAVNETTTKNFALSKEGWIVF